MTPSTGRRTAFLVLAAIVAGGLAIRMLVAHNFGRGDIAGIVADGIDTVLIWAVVRRLAPAAAPVAATFFAVNPAAIMASSFLGGRESLWWGVVLAAILIAFVIGPQRPFARLGIVAAAFAVPVGVFVASAAAYPYTSVNAFNLYAMHGRFWQPDLPAGGSVLLSPAVLGFVLLAASLVMIAVRYRERPDDRALLESAMLAAFAFFVFPTRVHESELYGAFLLAIPLLAFGGRAIVAAGVLSATALLNFGYAAAYQGAVAAHLAGADLTDLWPVVSRSAASLNVALFFFLGFVSLTSTGPADDPLRTFFARSWFRVHDWFSPREGLATMNNRDRLVAAGFAAAAFVLCVLWVQYPVEKIFDEVYYPRAAEEYLKHVDIGGHGPFEFTHPPLTKLLVAASMLLFGGLSGLGDTTLGWRFLNVVVGALMLPLAYAFTKRLTGSSLAATLAATLLLVDGFRFVQSRISTPEITVAVLSLAVLYGFYRLWTASQTRVRAAHARAPYLRAFAGVLAAAFVLAALAAWLAPSIGPQRVGPEWVGWARATVFAYVAVVGYLPAALVAHRAARTTASSTAFPDGAIARAGGGTASFAFLDGTETIGGAAGAVRSGPGWVRRFSRDGSERYETPAGEARYTLDGGVVADGVAQPRLRPVLWTVLLAVACGLLLSSKWNGILDPLIATGLAGVVALQRYAKRPALYGNPFGMRVDLLVASIVAISGLIYLLCYIPYFRLGHNIVDLIEMQHAMYRYHHDLVATHPYASPWWQWPLLLKPISYYYAAFPPYKATMAGSDCCVAEILALPNPLVWWTGLVAVPFVAFLAWKERSRGFLLLVVAYLMQWLPWALSPRIAFEYHFFPNLAIIAICDAVLLQRVWRLDAGGGRLWTRTAVITYVVAAIAIFAFFYPVLAGTHIPYDAWRARMWIYPQWV